MGFNSGFKGLNTAALLQVILQSLHYFIPLRFDTVWITNAGYHFRELASHVARRRVPQVYQRRSNLSQWLRAVGLVMGSNPAPDINYISHTGGRDMVQTVSFRLVTTETRVLISGQFMWDCWWTEWHWDMFFFLRLLKFRSVGRHSTSALLSRTMYNSSYGQRRYVTRSDTRSSFI